MGTKQDARRNMQAKSDCLKRLFTCADLYDKYLAQQSLLFIYRTEKGYRHIEAAYTDSNFKHLTGVVSALGPAEFYEACRERRLSLDAFQLDKNQLCLRKLKALNELSKIELTGKMIGEYVGGRPLLVCDSLAGSVHASMGFVKADNNVFYAPASALDEDIRNLIVIAHQIVAIYKKASGDEQYTRLTKLSKPLKAAELRWPKEIRAKIKEGIVGVT